MQGQPKGVRKKFDETKFTIGTHHPDAEKKAEEKARKRQEATIKSNVAQMEKNGTSRTAEGRKNNRELQKGFGKETERGRGRVYG